MSNEVNRMNPMQREQDDDDWETVSHRADLSHALVILDSLVTFC